MNILWVSNAPFTATGYGNATSQIVPELVKHGNNVVVLAYYGLQGGTIDYDGYRIVSPHNDPWGNDSIDYYVKHYNIDLVLIHRDIWVNDEAVTRLHPTAAWFPVDCSPLPNAIAKLCDSTRWLATPSKWAVEVLKQSGYKAHYIPHAINTQIFNYKRSPELRQQLYSNTLPSLKPEDFLVIIVAANKGFPSRKGFPEMFAALGEFLRRHSDVYVYVHSLVDTSQQGPDLNKLAKLCNLPAKRVAALDPSSYHIGVPAELLASIYQSADVLLSTSYGEGFGIPILEAQACGTPVITTNWSSMPELTYNGYVVDGYPWMNALYSYWRIPHIDQIVNALEQCYEHKNNPRLAEHSKRIADIIAREYSIETTYSSYWKPWLNQIATDLAASKQRQVIRPGSM